VNDQPPRQSFGEAAQQMRRDLIVSLKAYQVFCENAIEMIERPNCTVRAIYLVVSGAAANLEVLRIPQAAIEQWAAEPLADVGLDMPLGKMTGDTDRG
jgi:hypothetical protein